MPIINVAVKAPQDLDLESLVIQAVDIDIRSEQLLGECRLAAGERNCIIEYSETQIRHAEIGSADIILKALWDGRIVAESDVLFNAGDKTKIDLDIGSWTPTIRCPSELETLESSIAVVRDGVAARSLSDRDVLLLAHEAHRGALSDVDVDTLQERLRILRDSDTLAVETGVPMAAFYGWFRVLYLEERSLSVLNGLETGRLEEALQEAVDSNIISWDLMQAWDADELRIAIGDSDPQRLAVRLMLRIHGVFPDGREEVLTSAPIEILGEDRELIGVFVTDEAGLVTVTVDRAAVDAGDATLHLHVRFRGERPGETEVAFSTESLDIAEVRLPLGAAPGEAVEIGEARPGPLADRLRAAGIATFEDLLSRPDIEDPQDPETLAEFRREARLRLAAPDLDDAVRTALNREGHAELAQIPRAAFVRTFAEALEGEEIAHAVHAGLRRGRRAARHMLNSAWLTIGNDPDGDPDPDDLPEIVIGDLRDRVDCGCEDCENAASPAAYLAHLLDWTLDHVRDVADTISLDQLEEEFHQPFGELPTDCTSVKEELCQIRLAVEALWRFNGTLPTPDLELPTPHRLAYRDLRNDFYKAILVQLGTEFTQLRDAVLELPGDGPSADVAEARREAAVRALGIDASRLSELWFNVERPPISPSEEDLERLFGFRSTRHADVFAAAEQPNLATWQREYLLAAWQQQDWALDAFSDGGTRPVVDPAVITDAYLRAPLDQNPAATLLSARQTALDGRRADYVAADPLANGIADLLVDELGETIDMLRAHYAELQSDTPDPERVAQVHARIAAFGLTASGFDLLMGVDARQQAGEPLGEDQAAAAAVMNDALDALLGAHRRRLFTDWIEEEVIQGIVFGPRLFWLPIAPEPLPSPWLVQTSERMEWEAALGRRNAQPTVDPDQITTGYLQLLADDGQSPAPLELLGLWTARRVWVDGRLEALGDARAGAASSSEALNAMLNESTIGLAGDELAVLRLGALAGDVIDGRLAQLGLRLDGFRVLSEAQLLTDGGEALGSEQWDGIEAALVAAEKRLEVQAWRREEQAAGVLLHPDWFAMPAPLPEVPDTAFARGLHDPGALRDWIGLLRGRQRQLANIDAALANAVAEIEAAFLIGLRDLLIVNSVAPGNSLPEQAEWLDRRLLIDMGMTCCMKTTRVAQAIETLQRFIRGVYTREHPDLMQHLVLDADEDYVAEWPVIGTYATWKAYVLAYLYPENLLHLTPHPRLSHGYRKAQKNMRGGITPRDACRISQQYGEYFRDVCTLEIQASCQLQTVGADTPGDCVPTSTGVTSRLHLFGHAPESGLVYWAHLDPAGSASDTITTWTPLGKLGPVDRIVGATAHEAPGGQQYLLLFVQEGTALAFRRYDPSTDRWGAIKSLGGLPGASQGVKSVAVIQKRQSGGAFDGSDYPFPTIVGVTVQSGVTWLRALRPDMTGWSSEPAFPLYGPALGARVSGIRAMLQLGSTNYIIIADIDGEVVYRAARVDGGDLVRSDTYEWRRIARGSFRGAFVSPGTSGFFCFYSTGATTRYRHVDVGSETIEFDDQAHDFRDVEAFNRDWLIPVLGIDLDDASLFEFTDYNPDYFVPQDQIPIDPDPDDDIPAPLHPPGWVPLHREDEEGNAIPETLTTWNGDPAYSGTLLGLYTRDYEEFRPKFIPPHDQFDNRLDAEFDDAPWDRYFYLVQQKYFGLQQFLEWLKGIAGRGYQNATFGWWKFADDRVRELSEDGLSLAEVLEQLMINKIIDEREAIMDPDDAFPGMVGSWAPRGKSAKRIQFARRDAFDRGAIRVVAKEDWRIAPHSAEERAEPLTTRRITVVVMPEDGFKASKAVPSRVVGDEVIGSGPFALAPFGAGPFESLPLQDFVDLQQRRQHIELMYAPLLGERQSVLGYLREAYFHLPIAIGYRLQQRGFFDEACSWYRLVYDFLAEPGDRKIAYSLRLEMQGPLDYRQLDAFLDHPSDVHAIAATRRNTYTRNILILIISCLIEHADTLFARDTAVGNARARELYRLALRLLDIRFLKPGQSPCDNILGDLEIEMRGFAVSWPQLHLRLRMVTAPRRLAEIRGRLLAIRDQSDERDPVGATRAVRELLGTINQEPARDRRMAAIVAESQEAESWLSSVVLAHRPARDQVRESIRIGRDQRRRELGRLVPRRPDDSGRADFSWLRLRTAQSDPDGPNPRAIDLRVAAVAGRHEYRAAAVALNPVAGLGNLTGNVHDPGNSIRYVFCVPQNPVIIGLREHALINLEKLRSCRNIAGLRREVDPFGAPIGIGQGAFGMFGGAPVPQVIFSPPTPYRFSALIARAKELVAAAERMEAGYQSALENAEREAFKLLQAEQAVELASARVVLRDLFIVQAAEAVTLAGLQRNRAEFRHERYSGLIDAGLNGFEQILVKAVTNGEVNQQILRRLIAVGKGIAAFVQNVVKPDGKNPKLADVAKGMVKFLEIPITEAMKIDKENSAKFKKNELALAELNAGFARRVEEWRLEQGVAALDIRIADQEIRLAQGGVAIAEQERAIAALEQTHAVDTLNFLINKTFDEEMYLWIASVLGDVYRFILQIASATALLAERQLASERPQATPGIIKTDYWTPPDIDSSEGDRLGITGSARLLKDIIQLDQFAFDTRRRMTPLRITLDLAQLYPVEFQTFRETGVLIFETTLSMLERQFPGYYLTLIDSVELSLIGAFPPSYGVRGALGWAGTSRVILEGKGFQSVIIKRAPGQLALSADNLSTETTATLGAASATSELRGPLEGTGFETRWELHLPKASNPFDYNTIATAYFTVDLSAIYSADREREVVDNWDPEVETYLQISLRDDYEEVWQGFLDSIGGPTPTTLQFQTGHDTFPPNLSGLRIKGVTLLVIGSDEAPVVIDQFRFTSDDGLGPTGGPAQTDAGVVSTLRPNGTAWLAMIGLTPFGTWELDFRLDDSTVARFEDGSIQNVILLLSYSAERSPWRH